MPDLARAESSLEIAAASSLIWPPDALLRRVESPDADVRAWALRKLLRVDPAAAGRVAPGCLSDAHWSVRGRAVDVLLKIPVEAIPPEAAGAVIEFLRRPDGAFGSRMRAIEVLGRLGGAESRQALEQMARDGSEPERREARQALAEIDPRSVRLALLDRLASAEGTDQAWPLLMDLLSVAEPGDAPVILDRISRMGKQGAQTELISELMMLCGAEEILSRMPDEGPDPLGTTAAELEEAAGLDLRKRLSKEDREAVAAALRVSSWRAAAEGAVRIAESLPPLDEDVDPRLKKLADWTDATLKAIRRLGEIGRAEASVAGALALAAVRTRAVGDLLRGEAPAGRLVHVAGGISDAQADVLHDRVARAWAVGEAERDAIRQALSEEFRTSAGELRRVRAARLAARLDGFPTARRVLESLGADPGEWETESAAETLGVARPEELQSLVPEFLTIEKPRPLNLLLDVLADQPYRWAAPAILSRLDLLLRHSTPEAVWECLEELGDPVAIEPLLAEWRPGEKSAARIVDFLARLFGDPEKVPQEVRREAQELRHRQEAILEKTRALEAPGDALAFYSNHPLELDLRCNRCGRTYIYEVEEAWINPEERGSKEWDGIVLSRIIVCKKCGAEDEYDLTGRAWILMTSIMSALLDKGKPLDDSCPIKFVALTLEDGIPIRRPSHAFRRLREAVAAEPARADLRRRLGNLLRRYGCLKEAEEAYTKALDLDPKDLEAVYNMATLCLEAGRMSEAMSHLCRVIESLPRSTASREVRLAAAHSALGMLRGTVDVTREPLGLMAGWAGGAVEGNQVVKMSSVDLRRFRHWDALAEFLSGDRVMVAGLTRELPDDHPTILDEMLASSGRRAPARPLPPRPSFGGRPAISPRKVGRNARCPCGSGKKLKKCCG